MENENMLNITLDDLLDQLKDLVVTAVNQYQERSSCFPSVKIETRMFFRRFFFQE
jgi:hypothetical protein